MPGLVLSLLIHLIRPGLVRLGREYRYRSQLDDSDAMRYSASDWAEEF